MRYDRVTRLLHGMIAAGITAQMLVSLAMVYPKPGRLPNAWWEVHEVLGLALLGLLVAHWMWSISTTVLRGEAFLLFPWFRARGLRRLRSDAKAMVAELTHGRMPDSNEARPVAAAIQGLGLLIGTFLAASGAILWIGMAENGAMAPALRLVKEAHEIAGPAMWAYLIVHPALGVAHQIAGHRSLSDMFRV